MQKKVVMQKWKLIKNKKQVILKRVIFFFFSWVKILKGTISIQLQTIIVAMFFQQIDWFSISYS